MSAYSIILKTPAAFLLMMFALFLMIGQTAAFLLSLREGRNRNGLLAAALHLLAGFLLFVALLDGYDVIKYPSIPRRSTTGSGIIQAIPWMVYAALEVLSAGILTLQFRAYLRYRSSTVTPDAIRQTVDLLPEGICVSDADGTVRLANLKMNALCRELTGERLADSRRLWSYLLHNGEDQNGKWLIRTPRGEAWLFGKEAILSDGKEYQRIGAVNVTERYRITEELRKKNVHLQDVQHRMKEAVELSGEMFVRQEEVNARSALHNELGQVLLLGRRWLEHPESTDRDMVVVMTRQMNSFLLRERESPEPETGDELRQAIRMAENIGVAVELRGEPPEDGYARAILAQAVRECAANTVKHAEGDRLYAEINNQDEGLRILITNNGGPPKGPVAESGGLLSLRSAVETAGGRMTVQSAPRFSLTLSF